MMIAQSFAKRHGEIRGHRHPWRRTLRHFTVFLGRELSKKRFKILWDRNHPEDDNGTYDQAGWKKSGR